jgi:AcrR family transcriptional regulator
MAPAGREPADTESASEPRWRRLPPSERKRSILHAARLAFVETGDVNGTSMRAIAQAAGVREGLIYRYFASKEQLFLEAVVTPLRESMDNLVAASEAIDRDEPLSRDLQLAALQAFYHQLVATFDEIAPLLGLVLFGDPKVAQRFYRENLAVAMDRLGAVWQVVEQRYGYDFPSPQAVVRSMMGTALLFSMERRYNGEFDVEDAISTVATGNLDGFFPRLS